MFDQERTPQPLMTATSDALPTPLDSITILGVPVNVATGEAVLETIRLQRSQQLHVAYVNAHSLNLSWQDPCFRQALGQFDLVLNDGLGISMAARMRGVSFEENLNGSDFTRRILRLAATEQWTVFLYGGQRGVATEAKARLEKMIPNLRIVGTEDGYSLPAEDVAARVRRTGAHVLLVALGQPRQELWLREHLAATGCGVGIGVGAFLDFTARRVRRAPAWMNRLGIEWLFRLALEPSRLWRRYLVGNPLFLWRAWRSRKAESHAKRPQTLTA